MKHPIEAKNREVSLEDDEFIVTKTDARGVITYANEGFIRISGFTEAELLDAPHNVVRHPDMPRGVYHMMWENLSAGREFLGYIKNICKDGSFYWVFANVTPSYDLAGKMNGYSSVRRKPRRSSLDAVTPIYAEMLDIERRAATHHQAAQQSAAMLKAKLAGQNTDYDNYILQI